MTASIIPQDRIEPLSPKDFDRYSRNILLPEVGIEGQQRIRAAKVLVVGAGGLGAPVALYLAAAGVGTVGLVDNDVVDESNLQRQVIHGIRDIGRPKTASARDSIRAINRGVQVVTHQEALTSENALRILEPYDVVVDGTDNFPTRYLLNDAAVTVAAAARVTSNSSGRSTETVTASGIARYIASRPIPTRSGVPSTR
ncbi:HesA/MoeB/ThiF family protein [Acidipropionibacterium jensenii]|uniref:Probable adenylyltransferase/sulfurtransferase MoeZ n=1 Tax=Acidipropionibacterium jensenii TaxID=1749 RepID=A0A3S4V0Q8_9ACTN|nr:HesA/MoeB/ThiF family protein [Acidipropionibacterium jensenii]MDN5976271.1 HesA/MoeB/ThiF family protein [Acidipropionibacterium jensenii]MDN5995338.1 HesA/MoeB/ThiF family protein [Acidipropionibacterium jensenii]MDN6426595.1 HesA/MoeB/ThiF family protein [Acidipropionibacterium jensenii]MDN6440712.1 HesA/MoeB/ThiF family protein [Acidipropionibacterium jensenii]MDN6479620.1 HesA/MoeB/ThiF family protein [Acidipropionibacterium jensenii]